MGAKMEPGKRPTSRTTAVILFFCLLFPIGLIEQSHQDMFLDQTKIELSEAESQGIVRVKASGNGLEWIKILLESLSDLPLEIEILPGTIFEARSSGTQSMIIRERKVVYLQPKESKLLDVLAACIDMMLDAPDEGDSLTLKTVLSSKKRPNLPDLHLMNLLNLPTFLNESFRAQQFAIWTITENPSNCEDYVRLGYSGHFTGPSTEEMCKISALFKEADIPMERYPVLHDFTCDVCGCKNVCKGYNLWKQKCVDGKCVLDYTIESFSVRCGYDPCKNHCINGKKDCGEYAVDCGAGCPFFDSDADGVEDCLDICPDSQCDKVDASGCEIDTDKDGIIDCLDICPDSQCDKVDASGCEIDTDADGVTDCEDDCPDEEGDISNRGCPTYVDLVLVGILVGVTIATVVIISRYFFQVPVGPAPKGRKPEENERDLIEMLFPGLKKQAYTITDGPTPLLIHLKTCHIIANPYAYNCIGWSLCSIFNGWFQPPSNLLQAAPKLQLKWFDQFYAAKNWKISKNCKPEKGVRKIALYCNAKGYPSHAAKQIEDDWWESKLGQGHRVVHPGTGSLEGEQYGKVTRCYEKDLKSLLKDAQNLLKDIQNAIKQAPKNKFLRRAEKEAQEQIKNYEKAIKKEVKKK